MVPAQRFTVSSQRCSAEMPCWSRMEAETPVAFDGAPRIVIWEMTRACALACRHCRAEAIPARHPDELATDEAFALVDQVAECGAPLFILTGGDPLMRNDLFDIVA